MRLQFNRIGGTVPDEYYSLTQLTRLDLYEMNITSTISTLIGDLLFLETFRIRENSFYGTIPSEIGNLVSLERLWLHGNDLTGSVPLEVCSNSGSAALRQLEADCGPSNGVGPPAVQCAVQCCSTCCDAVTGVCIDA